jgi:hypothetical protein
METLEPLYISLCNWNMNVDGNALYFQIKK